MGIVPDPYPDFVNGSVADADQVDARFAALFGMVNGNLDAANAPSLVASSKVRTKRISTGSIAGGAHAAVTLTWDSPFADANYTVTVSVVQSDADTETLRVDHIQSVSATAVVVRIFNNDASARTGTLHAVAIHD